MVTFAFGSNFSGKFMAKKGRVAETPLMKQYLEIKKQHPDAILLFRVGDFYETFSKDAIKASGILGITLTKRANGAAQFVELAGFPHHALDTYLPKLVRAGQRVAICEQLEDPKQTKSIVKRGITELVTPGVSINENILNHKENNFLASVNIQKNVAGVSFLDISTGEFLVAEGTLDYVEKLISSFSPKEVLFERGKQKDFETAFGSKLYTFQLEDWTYNESSSLNRLLQHFGTKNLKGFGVENLKLGNVAAGAIIHYLDITHHKQIGHITGLSRIEKEKYVWLDRFTIRNLELFGSMNDGGASLSDVLDKTTSPMGARMLKRWIAFPLKDMKPINDRLDIVEYFFKNPEDKDALSAQIATIGDLERILSRVATGRVTPREIVQLKIALDAIPEIKTICSEANIEGLPQIAEQLNPCNSVRQQIGKEINPEPPTLVNKGNVIREGVSEELDELRKISLSGKDYLKQIVDRETERTGISSLKISYNNVFGYYIEVRNTHKDKVPPEWIRKQTLVSAERYITEELKELESKILGAEEKILTLETRIFNNLVFSLSEFIPAIQLNANLVAKLDCLLSFTKVAAQNNYFKPEVNESQCIEIKEGRHPVIETLLPPDEPYISNDVILDNEKQQVIIITGPNMSGKSALLRQTALITLMAQIGCFVPASKASIGLVDKIFTRVGASDNISLGESTFMVEMNEAASILNNISERSLILFDELGRGTSTYDGISIAWSIVEHIHEHPAAKARTLFATHYHELNEMEKSFKRIKNFNVSVKEMGKKVIFLRKLKAGGSNHSFGIHVAQMAGMPKSVVKRSNEILKQLENNNRKGEISKPVGEIAQQREGFQLSFIQLDDPILTSVRDEIANADINNLTPMEALNKLNEIKKLIIGK